MYLIEYIYKQTGVKSVNHLSSILPKEYIIQEFSRYQALDCQEMLDELLFDLIESIKTITDPNMFTIE